MVKCQKRQNESSGAFCPLCAHLSAFISTKMAVARLMSAVIKTMASILSPPFSFDTIIITNFRGFVKDFIHFFSFFLIKINKNNV